MAHLCENGHWNSGARGRYEFCHCGARVKWNGEGKSARATETPINDAIAAMRERCAKIAERAKDYNVLWPGSHYQDGVQDACTYIAREIRSVEK